MAPSLTDIVEEARLSARALLDYGEHFFNPTVRLGVTGLSRAGKTVFITALIHGLTRGGRFPVFEPFATGRIARAHLEPQPDDAVPRFDYENHLKQPDRGAVLAELDGRYQRIAAGDRLSARERRRPHADARHRRLSRRMAARPAAAQQAFRAMVGRKSCAVARAAARASCEPSGTRSSRRSIPRPARTSRRRLQRQNCSPTICAPAATSASP